MSYFQIVDSFIIVAFDWIIIPVSRNKGNRWCLQLMLIVQQWEYQ